MLQIINAPITPGTHAQRVKRKTIITEPQPLSITASGGNIIHRITRQMDMKTDCNRMCFKLKRNNCFTKLLKIVLRFNAKGFRFIEAFTPADCGVKKRPALRKPGRSFFKVSYYLVRHDQKLYLRNFL